MGIVFVNVTCPIVTQILVDPNQSLGIVAIPMTVYDVEPFSRVNVEQMQAVWNFRRTPTGRDPRTCRKKNKRYESEQEIPSRVGQAAPQSVDVRDRSALMFKIGQQNPAIFRTRCLLRQSLSTYPTDLHASPTNLQEPLETQGHQHTRP
jgi:hypothetical protein